jgi:hypothetical protein
LTSKLHSTYYKQFDDLIVTSIKGEKPSDPYSWGIARNFVYLEVGGCQQIVQADNEVVFAYAHTTQAHPTPTFLKLSGPTSAHPNTDVTLKVTDGAGATIDSVGIYQLGSGEPKLLGKTDAKGCSSTVFRRELMNSKPTRGTTSLQFDPISSSLL